MRKLALVLVFSLAVFALSNKVMAQAQTEATESASPLAATSTDTTAQPTTTADTPTTEATASAPETATTANTAAPASTPQKAEENPAWMQYNNPYTSTTDSLDIEHITENELVNWSQESISEVFTFTPQDYASRLQMFKGKYFTKTGWLKYAKFLKESGTLELITSNGYKVSSIVREAPMIIDKKVIDGEFHWIVKMDTSISFMAETDKKETKTLKTGSYNLYLDIKRTPKEEVSNSYDIAINDIRLTPNTGTE